MEYYSAIKKNETGSFVKMWVDLEIVIQGKVIQKEENKYHMLTYYHIYEESIKMVKMIFANRNRGSDEEKKMYWHQKGKGGGGMN